ncbi:MAG TPA: 16S rRNA (cytosine(967)-C(5))-methyltransferase RsmB [Burkholderiaceae bacterium]|nr:16S rRNA (cytosine(967)-C(5))-methyltransferase RsmB [Burkholderiaceae bacterium]
MAAALRLAAAAWQQLRSGTALGRALELAAIAQRAADHPRTFAAAQDIVYAATRNLALVEALVARLAIRPPAPRVAALLAVSLAQLIDKRHATYAVVDQAVTAARRDRRTASAAGFINAALRSFLRSESDLLAQARRDEVVRFNAPRWWIERLQREHPQHWRSVLATQGEAPPMVVRVNARRASVAAYLERLQREDVEAIRVGAQAVWLQRPRPVEQIPGFIEGQVSVQDAGSQLAAQWLDVQSGQRVLDACAAPGGKTGHLAEMTDAQIDAVELDAQRAARIESNLSRLGLADPTRIRVLVGDASMPAMWPARPAYERILIDAPCTASGIVRRHPDIPWLRRAPDVAQLATIQARLLDALWPLLAPTGRLLYTVCSLFTEEGSGQAARFLERWADARALDLPGQRAGSVQLLPTPLAQAGPWPREASTPSVHDGFFYALFEKR